MKIYYSLTTIPSRFQNIDICLTSLLNQILKPEKIYVNICKSYSRFPNEYITNEDIEILTNKIVHENKNIIEFLVNDIDYGPGTKLMGAINNKQFDNDSILILVDDDRTYLKFVSNLYAIKLKNNHAASFHCSHMTIHNTNITIGQGYGGFGFNMNIINFSNIQDYIDSIKRNKFFFFHDDLWISYFMYLKGYQIQNISMQSIVNLYNAKYTSNRNNNSSNPLIAISGKNSRGKIIRRCITFIARNHNLLKDIANKP